MYSGQDTLNSILLTKYKRYHVASYFH